MPDGDRRCPLCGCAPVQPNARGECLDCGHEADRVRYREALERIAQGDVPGVTFADNDLISAFAQEALDA